MKYLKLTREDAPKAKPTDDLTEVYDRWHAFWFSEEVRAFWDQHLGRAEAAYMVAFGPEAKSLKIRKNWKITKYLSEIAEKHGEDAKDYNLFLYAPFTVRTLNHTITWLEGENVLATIDTSQRPYVVATDDFGIYFDLKQIHLVDYKQILHH